MFEFCDSSFLTCCFIAWDLLIDSDREFLSGTFTLITFFAALGAGVWDTLDNSTLQGASAGPHGVGQSPQQLVLLGQINSAFREGHLSGASNGEAGQTRTPLAVPMTTADGQGRVMLQFPLACYGVGHRPGADEVH